MSDYHGYGSGLYNPDTDSSDVCHYNCRYPVQPLRSHPGGGLAVVSLAEMPSLTEMPSLMEISPERFRGRILEWLMEPY